VLSAANYGAIGKGFGRHNERNHITGGVLLTGADFLGIVERREWELDNLWLRVEKDKRHCDPIRIGDMSRGQRSFPDWMAYTVHSDVSVIREIP
jgi:hypothetical protein